MTREEAIDMIKHILESMPKEPPTECDYVEEWLCEDDEIRKALDIAIKSLEQTIDKEKMIEELEESLQKANATLVDGKQKPCEDVVSRKAVLNTLDKMDSVLDENRTVETYKELLIACYNDLPPVTPTQRWIPCSERLPENKTYVLTTIKVPNRIAHTRSGWYEGGFFHNDNGDVWRATDMEVVAWMPLPEPYKAESEEKE